MRPRSNPWRAAAVALVAAVAIAALGAAVARPVRADEPEAGRVDHTAWTTLLGRHVDDRGLVDYAGWKRSDVPALKTYLDSLRRVDPAKLADDHERMAFWINAYNAHTIEFMISKWPTDSIRDHTARFFGFNVWEDYPLRVAGRNYSLEEIEHEVLRPMGEPLIHLGLNCASMGCPRLRNEAYTGERLIEQLTGDLQAMLADPTKFEIDRDDATVHISKIFSWFEDDWGGSERRILDWIGARAESEDVKRFLARTDIDVDYKSYDWAVNAQGE